MKILDFEKTKNNFLISTDPSKLDLVVIHTFLRNSYWAKNIPFAIVKRAIENSLCFVVYDDKQQVGFARVVSDFAVFAYIADVFILEAYRGKGLSVWMMESIVSCPELQGLRRWMLATRDAHGVYAKVGFKPIELLERWMEKHVPDVYRVQ
jgi:GNAT superfamily N-acetyltransferase